MLSKVHFVIRCALISVLVVMAIAVGRDHVASAAQNTQPAECVKIDSSTGEIYFNPATDTTIYVDISATAPLRRLCHPISDT